MQFFRKNPFRATTTTVRLFSAYSSVKLPRTKPRETEEWGLFPREYEGNEYLMNWSLIADGVCNTTEAFRNARLPILTTRLKGKVENGKAELSSPEYTGKSDLKEAGLEMSFEDFESAFAVQKERLSAGIDLLVEDMAMGSYNGYRLGTRVITDDAAIALIMRKLLVTN